MKYRFLYLLPFFLYAEQLVAQNVYINEGSGSSLERMDAELSVQKNQADSQTQWVNALRLGVQDVGWYDGMDDYTRLPDKFQAIVTENVWRLSRCSSGISIRFSMTGSEFIDAKWTLRNNVYMPHMAPVGINGLDLYVRLDGKWQWAGIGKPDRNGLEQHAMIKKGFLPERVYECLLYLPLYSGIANLELGFSPKAKILPLTRKSKPVVIYGTSIVHGCSASRPGMAFPSMLGRYFDIPVVNLGFSGNGLMEGHFAKILAEVDASIYIIDCLPNMSRYSDDEIYSRTLYLVTELHRLKPNTPIMLVEDRSYAHPNLTGRSVLNKRRAAQKRAFRKLKKQIPKLYYVEGDLLLGNDNEATVDGSHPTDLGMMRYFVVLKPMIKKILKRLK